jgi:hypothetical protein
LDSCIPPPPVSLLRQIRKALGIFDPTERPADASDLANIDQSPIGACANILRDSHIHFEVTETYETEDCNSRR